jgi:hypothetical protein
MKLALIAAIAAGSLIAACSSQTALTPASGSASIRNSCINPADIQKQTIVSDQEIRFDLRNGETWVNQLPRSCPGLKIAGGFNWEVTGGLVCSNQQRITVLEDGTPCQLGAFSKLPSPA